MGKTKIEWTDATWNPVTGCTSVSPGCAHCYAKRLAKRLAGRCGYPESPNEFDVTLHLDKLNEPLRWKKPRQVFVCSMSDLFHEDVPDGFIAAVFEIMRKATRHTFQVLTKRPERMKDFVDGYIYRRRVWRVGGRLSANVWLGVTAENQEQADRRIPILLQIPATVRFVSVEPMLEEISLLKFPLGEHGFFNISSPTGWEFCKCGQWGGSKGIYLNRCPYCGSMDKWKTIERGIDWVICGGESGKQARPMHPEWVRSVRDQCVDAEVPFFFKQWGEWFPRSQWEGNPDLVLPDDRDVERGPHTFIFDDGEVMHYVGKKKAGRLLDSQEWNEFPEWTRG